MTTIDQLNNYSYRGARAMVILHEQHMNEFLSVWREAKAANLTLPKTDDPDYASLETLLGHVLGAARGYMTWMCEQLNLPDPQIAPRPDAQVIEAEAESYLEQLLTKWRLPLAEVPEERFGLVAKSRWHIEYCIDAMLEHAVMHPIRHTFQLRELLQKNSAKNR